MKLKAQQPVEHLYSSLVIQMMPEVTSQKGWVMVQGTMLPPHSLQVSGFTEHVLVSVMIEAGNHL